MDLENDWAVIRRVFIRAQRSGLHHAFATVGPDGEPQVTPIGSLWLARDEPRGIYLDVFNQRLASHLNENHRVSILAVDSRYSMWLGALLRGRFAVPPGVRLLGNAGERRRATEKEADRFRRMFAPFRFTRGHRLLWSAVDTVREVNFDGVAPVRIGRMTRSTA